MDTPELIDRIKNLRLASRRLLDTMLSGEYRSVFRGQGIEFNDVREYNPGDDARGIDWNVTSRFGSPYSKTFCEERELTLFLLLDVSRSMYSGAGEISKKDYASLLFSLCAFAAEFNNNRLGAAFFSQDIDKWVAPRTGSLHTMALIHDAVGFPCTERATNLDKPLRAAAESLKRRGLFIIISDFKTDGYWQELSILARKHDVIAIRLWSADDRELPAWPLLRMEDPETGATLFLKGKAARDAYAKRFDEDCATWKHECYSRGVSPVITSTTDDPAAVLIRHFAGRHFAGEGRS
jgi:uncharacterized protein (DUF58 family)